MANDTYLNWVIKNTPTQWWHDSAEAGELQLGLERGAIGVTTNPFLSNIALVRDRQLWAADIDPVLAQNLPAEQKAEALMRIPVTKTCAKLMPEYEGSEGQCSRPPRAKKDLCARRSTRYAPATATACWPWPGGCTPGRPISP